MRAGISTPVSRQFTFHVDVDWMKKITMGKGFLGGIVLWSHICFADKAEDIPEWLFRHELEHVYQQIRDGRFRFYLKYFYYQIRYGYKKNPYEVEARERQHLPLQESEEQALWNLREN
jgi:hypothetical protein